MANDAEGKGAHSTPIWVHWVSATTIGLAAGIFAGVLMFRANSSELNQARVDIQKFGSQLAAAQGAIKGLEAAKADLARQVQDEADRTRAAALRADQTAEQYILLSSRWETRGTELLAAKADLGKVVVERDAYRLRTATLEATQAVLQEQLKVLADNQATLQKLIAGVQLSVERDAELRKSQDRFALLLKQAELAERQADDAKKKLDSIVRTPAGVPDVPTITGGESAIESRIDGTFEGWTGETIFKLQNGQIWQQSMFAYWFYYAFMPKVVIYRTTGGWKMKVEGVDQAVFVKRIK